MPDDVLADSQDVLDANALIKNWNFCNFRCAAFGFNGYQTGIAQTACKDCYFPHVRLYEERAVTFYDFFKDDLGSPTNATFMLANGFAYYTEN